LSFMHTSSGIKNTAVATAIAGCGVLGAGIAAALPAQAASAPPRCLSSHLAGSIASENGGGTAGSVHETLKLKNTGSADCTLYGYPGVSWVTGNSGRQVGAAAVRVTGVKEGTVLLPPGAVAQADLTEADPGNYPDCSPTVTRGFRVYPPGETAALFVARPGRACANPADKDLKVRPVTPGAGASYLASSSSHSYHVVNEQTAVPSGYNIDVAGQNATSGTQIIEWQANRNDPGQDFAQVTAPNGGTFLAYVPFGSLASAKTQPAGYARTHAEAAYSSDGTAKYCVGVAPNPGAGAQLVPCGTQGTGLRLLPGVDPGHHIITSANSHLALNDAAFGHNGSWLISWHKNSQQNEEFYAAG
jgi:Domain of unknown function (DUF4232)